MSKTSSFGILNIKLCGTLSQYNDILKQRLIGSEELNEELKTVTDIPTEHISRSVICTEIQDVINGDIYEEVCNSIKFLLISRKHSLGFIEFVRGHYDPENRDTIIHLLKQMTELELNMIHTESFDTIWTNVWVKKWTNKHGETEYNESKRKYNQIKSSKTLSSLRSICAVNPIPEWGIPKGRKNFNECDYSCAVRECYEETGVEGINLNVLTNIGMIEETVTGTNNITYKHNYFLSLTDAPGLKMISPIKSDYAEIDQICWLKLYQVRKIIRRYHVQKLNLFENVAIFIANEIYKYKNNM